MKFNELSGEDQAIVMMLCPNISYDGSMLFPDCLATVFVHAYREGGLLMADMDGDVLTANENIYVNEFCDLVAHGTLTLPNALALLILRVKQQYLLKSKEKENENENV